MPIFTQRSVVSAPAQTLFEYHAGEGAFERLAPPWQNITVLEKQGTITDGSRLVIQLRQGPIPIRMEAHHKNYVEGRQFTDELVKSPFRKWEHTHRFIPYNSDQSILDDTFEYQLPLHPISQWVGGWFAHSQFKRMFRFRHQRTQNDLERHQRYAQNPRQTVAITGASGLIGRNLTAFLTTGGHTVKRLVRNRPTPDSPNIYWNPQTGEIDADKLDRVDTVIHLAGENIAGGRWSEKRKKVIYESRVEGTQRLCEALARMKNPPKTLLCASAIGFYGNRGDELLHEVSESGEGFLAQVVRDWEAATAPAEAAGIRVVHLRIGVVMAMQGGAIAKMLLPFLFGAGGRLGNGQQYLSWISLEDTVGAFYHAMFTESLSGAVNVVAPNPVTNAKFTGTFGRVLRRPTIFPIPTFAIRLLFGQMGQETLLSGAKVSSEHLCDSGFTFLYPELETALRYETGRLRPSDLNLQSAPSAGEIEARVV